MDLAAWGMNRVARTGMTNAMAGEGAVNHLAVLRGMNRITDHLVPPHAEIKDRAVRAEAVPAIPAVALPVCLKMKYAV